MLKSGVGSFGSKRGPPPGDRVSEHLYLRRQVGRTRVTSLLQDLTGHPSLVVGGIVHWSVATPALTCRLLPTVKGYYLSVDHYACLDTPPVASYQGLKTVKKRVSGATELEMGKRYTSGTIGLMITELRLEHDWTDDGREARLGHG
ncbi:hypothetical protein BHE74_00030953 [Ensete ventricosum]|nr:hypothetical protein BHE74_00030953 [Ensete ventricosum]